jgi:branched-chain amino acid transport system permease protein
MYILYSIKTIFISGLVLGSLYSVMSAGLSLIWGTLRMYNFSHGSLIMLGAFIAWQVNQVGGLLFAIIISIIIMFFIAMIMEKILIEPFFAKPGASLMVVITTLGGMLIINSLSQIIWGVRMKQLPVLIESSITFLGSKITGQELIIILLAPIVLILFSLFLKKSKIGLAIRAVEQNLDFSLLVGINIFNIYMITFGISAILACIAGILLGSVNFITPSMGGGYLLKAFVIVVLGGIGSISGTLLSAYLIGIIEAASQFYLGLYWTQFVLFLILIFTLIFKPEGILGGKDRQ